MKLYLVLHLGILSDFLVKMYPAISNVFLALCFRILIKEYINQRSVK